MSRAERAAAHVASIIAVMKHKDEWKDEAINAARLLAIAVRDYHLCRCEWVKVIRALRRWQRAVGVTQTPLPEKKR